MLAFNKYPVTNVVVKSKKAKVESLTDSLGRFRIEVKEKDFIFINTEGFERVSEPVNENVHS